ncbi:methyl-accepting chemotaxis protein [Tissierella sp. MSJ-40]|uniref:Methyl-accepting chemotaxis protein n=1 Tax=Tissierella simiarum TaxID=2841534 RepID=A0ABS6E259_9FIRM|nr:methyl-accepting chemotaxis protein [Tissierella simiarum]MBU5436879.1 methyl-accepting chemotaxis protein [Tissierella simiarum]
MNSWLKKSNPFKVKFKESKLKNKKVKNKDPKDKKFKFKKIKGNELKINKLTTKSISKSMILSVTFVIVYLTIALGSSSFIISKNSLVDSVNELLLNKATDAANLVGERIQRYSIALETLGNLEDMGDENIPWEEKVKILNEEKSRLRFSNIGIADVKGNLILDDGTKLNVYEQEFFQRAKMGYSHFSEPFKREETGKTEVAISAPVRHKGMIIGSIVAFKSADEFYYITNDVKIGESGFAYILDEQADVISHPTVVSNSSNENVINFNSLRERVTEKSKNDLESIINSIVGKISGTGKYTADGETMYLGYAPIKFKGWTVIVNVNEKEALAGLTGLRRTLIKTSIVSLVIGLFISYFSSQRIAKRIVDISSKTKTLADLDLRFSVDEKSLQREDEIGLMARSIQTVIDSMRSFALEVQESSQHVAASSEELAAISQQSAAASTSVAEAANEIAQQSDVQLQEILGVSSAMQEVAKQFMLVMEQAKLVDGLSKSSHDSTEKGKEMIDEVIGQMDNIKDSTSRVKNSLVNINDSSKKMDEILVVIQSVAEETNLLALNAAIEAARAGEYGRGFAVVADEIRKLAEQTQKSTEEINNLIKNNHSLIVDANKNMEFSNTEVNKGIEKVNETKNTFDEIAEMIKEVAEGMAKSSESVAKVEDSLEDAVFAIANTETITREVAGQVQNVSAATQEQTASAEEITSSTEALAKLADELQEIIKHIKL